MPFPMKIQPIDSHTPRETIRTDSGKPVLKSRLKRLFDKQFPGVLKISSTEKPESQYSKDGGVEFEPSSVCLAKMVQNFIEESNEKPAAVKCGRNRCNCFNGNGNDSSDDEFDGYGGFGETIVTPSSGDASDILKVADASILFFISMSLTKVPKDSISSFFTFWIDFKPGAFHFPVSHPMRQYCGEKPLGRHGEDRREEQNQAKG